MVSRMIMMAALIFAAAFGLSQSVGAQQQRGRGDGQRGTAQRGAPQRGQRAPPVYYGGGIWSGGYRPRVYGPPVDGGRWYQGRYYLPGAGPCWALVPILGWTWVCPSQ